MSFSADAPPMETNPRAWRCLLGMAGPLVALNLPGLGWGVRIWRRKGLAGAHGSIGIEHTENRDDGSSTEGGDKMMSQRIASTSASQTSASHMPTTYST